VSCCVGRKAPEAKKNLGRVAGLVLDPCKKHRSGVREPGPVHPSRLGDADFPCLSISPLEFSCCPSPPWELSSMQTPLLLSGSVSQQTAGREKNPLAEWKRTSIQGQLLWGQRGKERDTVKAFQAPNSDFVSSFTNPSRLVVALPRAKHPAGVEEGLCLSRAACLAGEEGQALMERRF